VTYNAAFVGVCLAGLLYVVTAAGYWYSGRLGMAIVFAGYTVGNVGFIVDQLGY